MESMEPDRLYFARRAKEERAASETATHPQAKRAHVELAQRYEDLALAIAAEEHGLGLSAVH